MASDYPGGIDSFRTIANVPGETFDASKTTRVYAEDLQYLEEDIIAIETTLGINPQGGESTVKDLIDTKEDALGFTPENVANKKTTLADNSDTYYPTQKAVKTAVDGKENSLGFTPEDVANKSTNTSLGTSDTLYPSQKAVKTYVDNAVPSAVTAASLIPQPAFINLSANSRQRTGNTTAAVVRIVIPFKITVNTIYIRVGNITVNGTYKLGIFSEDGQTRHISVTTPTTATQTNVATTVSPGVTLNPGVYYFVIVPVGTADVEIATLEPLGTQFVNLLQIASIAGYSGTITVTASTMPTTITPTAITYSVSAAHALRLN